MPPSVDVSSEAARQALIGTFSREQALERNAIKRTKKRLEEYEQRYGMKTEEFYEKFESGELGDLDDYIDWAGEYELLQHAKEEKKEVTRMLNNAR
jgi:hypothetical protein